MEDAMEHARSSGPPLLGERYELLHDDLQSVAAGPVEVIDRKPWLRCWACGATDNQANESFCNNCGASLEQRSYHGTLSPVDQPDALALIATIEDEQARTILPAIWDVVDFDSWRLVLREAAPQGSIELPLDELAALRVGAGVAHLLAVLHERGLALGKAAASNLLLTPEAAPLFVHAPPIHPIAEGQQADEIAADLRGLASLLEALTATPRTTQRLPDNDQERIEPEKELHLPEGSELGALLRQIRVGEYASTGEIAARFDELIAERTRPHALRQIVGSASDTGIVRDHNEDSLLALNLRMNNSSADYTRALYVVADGMGGHAAGEVASRLAIIGTVEVVMHEYLPHSLDPEAPFEERQTRQILTRAILQANDAVREAAHARGNDMGTTITAALVVGDRAVIANVGDSRTYLYRDNKLRRISRDHSLVMRLVEIGQLEEADIYTHPQRNAVLRSLGDQLDIEVDLFSERLRPGDALLLCSDGLWEMTHDAEMEHLLAQHADNDVQSTCQALVNAANQAGGEDNISVILVRLEEL